MIPFTSKFNSTEFAAGSLEFYVFSCEHYFFVGASPWKLALQHGGPDSISIERGPWVQFP